MTNYGPFGGTPVSGSNSAGGAYDISGFPNSSTAPAVAPLINTEIVRKSFPTMVQYLLPKGDATLFALSSRFKEETAAQIEHGFFAKVMIFPTFQVNGAIADGTTTALTVVDSSQVIPGGLYKRIGVANTDGVTIDSPDTTLAGEIILVTAVGSSTAITATRNVGTLASPITSIADKSVFVHIGNAFGDASTRPNSFLTREIRVINYTQIFRNAWAISGTVAAIQNLIGDTNIAKSRVECSQYHAKEIEAAIIWGKRQNTTGTIGTSYASRTLNGVVAQITDTQSQSLFLPGASQSGNITTANSKVSGTPTTGALNIDDFESWANHIFDMAYDPMSGMERVLFVGRTAHTVLNKLSRLNSTYFMENGKTEWGLRFGRMHLTRGDLIIIEHPLLNTNPFWQTLAIAIDIPSISIAYLAGRKTKSEEYNQSGIAIDNAIDAQGGSLLTELTVLCKNPAGCGVYTNILTAVDPAGVQH